MQVLPYMEHSDMYQRYVHINKFSSDSSYRYSGSRNVPVTRQRITSWICPSDAPGQAPISGITSHNYSSNFGNTSYSHKANLNGVKFAGAPFYYVSTATDPKVSSLTKITALDGTSNTLLFAEVVAGRGRDLRGFGWWGDASEITTYLLPNSTQPDAIYTAYYCQKPSVQPDNPPCTTSTGSRPTMFASRSRHPGGVQVVMGDGSGHFITNQIALWVWRGLGTTYGSEQVSLANN